MKNVNVQKFLNSRNEYLKENIIFHEGHLPISVGAGIGAYVSIEYQDKHKQLMNYVNEEFGR